jgi:2-polyprenyl-3-methyl-5-hydroxy-6-metoxy-1,4-benzoquinol methylase
VKKVRDYTFARFTNDHSACYLLTQEQLGMAIASGGFLVEPHQERYDLLVTAATDPYTQCGLTKVICVSHLEDFCLHHLPNQYIGRVGVSNADLQLQLDALISIASNGKAPDELFKGETALKQGRWSKSYYEEGVEDLIGMMPSKTKDVLSIGCGRGATEGILVEQGMRVTAVPLDSVIGACAKARGVEIVPSDSEKALDALSGRSFDCILFMNVLEHLPDPVGILSRYAKLLSADGVVLISVPNFNHIKVWRDLLRGGITWRQRYDFEKSRLHFTTMNVVKRWLKRSGIKVVNVVYQYDGPWHKRSDLLGGAFKTLLASKIIVIGKRVRE